ncbi:hypothetical protein [Metasolibacillus meyeri]|uniref:hypothetical protein n=1 Tax=Metasolibacillus meyeri TaxID=1071052 RepID=UPI000D30DBAF|nr:hypothetical protein [Metasolibacillus meyeri]
MLNKHGIPICNIGNKRKKPKEKLNTRTFLTTVEGVEVTAVIPDFSPIQELLIKNGWKEIDN